MLTRMVIFAIFHSSVYAGKLSNETNFNLSQHVSTTDENIIENCLRMCCKNESECDNIFNESAQNLSFINDYKILYGKPCENMRTYDKDWSRNENGVYISSLSDNNPKTLINLSKYCLQVVNDSDSDETNSYRSDKEGFLLLFCDDDEQSPTGDIEKQLQRNFVRVIGTSISLPLLIITLFVMWYLGQFHTIQGKCLMCHILSLVLLYTFLILDRMNDLLIKNLPRLCEISGYMMYTSILFCIFWLNVMCFDIWNTFKKTRNPKLLQTGPYYFYYCLFYGFGLPIIIVLCLAVIDETEFFPEHWRPQIGKSECFLRNDRNIEFFYLYLPMSIILLANIVLYSATAYKIYKVQNDKFILSGKIEQRRRNVSCNPIRIRFFLYLRLFVLMGLTWSIEAISWIYDYNTDNFFIVADIANSFHGFVIFGLFVCRTNIIDSVLTKQRSNNRLTLSLVSSKFQDSSKRNSLSNEDVMMRFLKDKRAGNC